MFSRYSKVVPIPDVTKFVDTYFKNANHFSVRMMEFWGMAHHHFMTSATKYYPETKVCRCGSHHFFVNSLARCI